ncbi:hypothetical protein MY11210_008902 [Beauveria gryllotalpidicola]
MQDPDLTARMYATQHAGRADEAIESSIHYPVASAERSCAGPAATQDLFQVVNLGTRLDTHTPGFGLVCLNKEIGRGGFAVVTYHWNVQHRK